MHVELTSRKSQEEREAKDEEKEVEDARLMEGAG